MFDSQAKPTSDASRPSDHRAVIDLWPSLSEFARDIGTAYGTAKNMRRRKSIPDTYRPAVVRKAQERGIPGVTFELLTTTAARPR